ncbi:hypothetical protein GCM10018779_45090 [Streptomyces griseocarneus]|nr:hypothetical protein GCM10018779_45090 [Streptomyces griseocarneus]
MTAPVRVVGTGRPPAAVAPGRWYGPRVPLPPLSIDTLRGGGTSPRKGVTPGP